MKKDNDKKIILIAGALDLPLLAKKALKKNGWNVFTAGIKNFYDPKLKPDIVIRLGGAGRLARAARRLKITKLMFVGSLGHPKLYDIRPDLWSLSLLINVIKNQKGYDSMGAALNKVLEKRGYEIVAAQDAAPELTFETAGIKTKTKPTARDKKNIDRAIEVSHTIGVADIGASVVVDRQVIAVEAAEGTANMLARVIEMRRDKRRSSGVFAKMTKPGQDLRIDIPAIGVDTVNAVADAHLRGIVVNCKTCFIVNKAAVIRQADKRKIFILAVK